jgi:hypothetical protein
MRTSGKANDGVMALVPIAVLVLVATMLLGGPIGLFETLDQLVSQIISAVVGLFS